MSYAVIVNENNKYDVMRKSGLLLLYINAKLREARRLNRICTITVPYSW